MTFSRFVVRNSLRNKRRAALTILSVGFSIFLLIFLRSVLNALTNPPETEGSARRIAVRRSTSLADQLPLAYEPKIAAIPGVETVMRLQWFGGVYKEPKNFFANFAVDHAKIWNIFPELEVSEDAKKAFEAERIAAVVGKSLADKYGWKVDDRVTLKGTIFPVDLEFRIVGIFTSELSQAESNFYFRHDYLDEALGKPGNVGTFWVMAANDEAVPSIIEKVDAMFKNTPAETKTETEKAFQLGFVSMLGNVQRLIGYIGLVILFTMLLVSASTMAMTIRERMREVGILKSIGYPRGIVLALILGEAIFIAFLGGIAGSGAAFSLSLLDLQAMTGGFIERLDVAPSSYAGSVIAGIAIGLLSGILPALQASNMSITQAIKRLN